MDENSVISTLSFTMEDVVGHIESLLKRPNVTMIPEIEEVIGYIQVC